MKEKIALLFVFAALFGTQLFSQQKIDTVTNKTVIQLKSAGLGNDVIKAKIQGSICNFDLSTDGLIALKKAGVSDDLISSMLTQSNNSQSNTSNQPSQTNNSDTAKQINSGIYYCKGSPCNMIELEATVYSSSKEGSGVLSALTYGAAKTKLKATLSGSTANMQINETSPQFYFYFDKNSNSNFGNSNTQYYWFSGATSPNEFMLIRFSKSKNDKSREVVTGSIGAYSGLSSGIDDKHKITFRFEKMSQGVYRVYTEKSLEKGEYCFMYAGGAAETFGTTPLQKVYDFSIK